MHDEQKKEILHSDKLKFMRIHSMTKLIAFPFMILGGVILYLLLMEDMEDLYIWLFPVVLILATLYAFYPKIDFWWHQKQPPALDKKLLSLVERASPYYRKLDRDEKQVFQDRISLFIHHKAFYLMRKEKEDMPIDMRTLIAINAATISFRSQDYFFEKYDYFIAYQHAFPTPKKKQLHSVEVDHEDGVILFNSDQLFQHMVLNNSPFNTGLYGFAEAYIVHNPLSDLVQAAEPDPRGLDQFKALNLERIIQEIGYREIILKAVLLSLYFTYPTEVEKYYPDFFALCQREF